MGAEHIMKNMEDWWRKSSLYSNVHRSVTDDVVGKPGLVSCQLDSEFDEMLQIVMKRCGHIEKEYMKDSKSKFSNYFIKNKAKKITSKLIATKMQIEEKCFKRRKPILQIGKR